MKRSNPSSSGAEWPRCAVCGKEARYRCPNQTCRRQTCSLTCCREHKERFSCTGQRDRTAFVPLSQYDDEQMFRDFYLLEEASRAVGQSARHPLVASASAEQEAEGRKKRQKQRQRRLSPKSAGLFKACQQRGVDLRVMETGMTRHEQNTSVYTRASKEINWRIELTFPDANTTLVEASVSEGETWAALLERVLEPRIDNLPARQALRTYGDAHRDGRLCILLRVVGRPANKEPLYDCLLVDQPIQEALTGKTVIEYPTIVVVKDSTLNNYCIR